MGNGITEDKYGVGRDKKGKVKYMRGAKLGGSRAEGKATPVKNAAGIAGDDSTGYFPKSPRNYK